MSEKYKFHNPDGLYFITSTIVNWIDVFTKPHYKQIIIDSLKYLQTEKGLVIHAWVMMTNHLHLIISRNGENLLSGILRDFKRHTSLEIIRMIKDTSEPRKKWMLQTFQNRANELRRVAKYKVWQDGNHPILLESNEMIETRLAYLHDNPVKAGFVDRPEYYLYSSAIDYWGDKGLLDVELII